MLATKWRSDEGGFNVAEAGTIFGLFFESGGRILAILELLAKAGPCSHTTGEIGKLRLSN
jgi:hypothetical protein